MSELLGLVLAAGAGRRLGGPKALVADPEAGTWLGRAVAALRDGGVSDVYVVVGASADEVRTAVPAGCHVVEAADWPEGMGASLRAGLAAVGHSHLDPAPDAVLVMLVDTLGVGAKVVRRMADHAGPTALARALYDGEPGHPVLIGRAHWAGVAESAHDDRGARDYLRSHRVTSVECGDIGSGGDVDTPALLAAWRASTAQR
jgi:CTP:molybdopterin cytidylyltransferase MocA